MSDEIQKLNTVPAFDAKYGSYSMWATKFMSYAYMNGFADALEENNDLPADDKSELDASVEANKPKIRMRKANVKAI